MRRDSRFRMVLLVALVVADMGLWSALAADVNAANAHLFKNLNAPALVQPLPIDATVPRKPRT